MFWRRGLWQDFALLVMLCSWMAIGAPQKEPYEILDFFSGRGRIATLASRAGFACAATDMAVDKDKRGQRCRLKASRSFRSVMDWNGDSGFASFGGTSPRASVQQGWWCFCAYAQPMEGPSCPLERSAQHGSP